MIFQRERFQSNSNSKQQSYNEKNKETEDQNYKLLHKLESLELEKNNSIQLILDQNELSKLTLIMSDYINDRNEYMFILDSLEDKQEQL